MQTLLKDLLLGIFLVCVTLAFTTLLKAADEAPDKINMHAIQPNEAANIE
jgi:hypothetical protein